jgi:hypothetical protein
MSICSTNDGKIIQLLNEGRIRANFDGTIERFFRGNWHVMPTYTSPSGYERVSIKDGGRKYKLLVHRIVLVAFHGPSELETDHIDDNKSNNHLSNLRYVTRSANCSKRIDAGGFIEPALTKEELDEMRELKKSGATNGDLVRKYKITYRTVKIRLEKDYSTTWNPGRRFFFGDVTLRQYCKSVGISYDAVTYRIRNLNESVEQALMHFLPGMKVAA